MILVIVHVGDRVDNERIGNEYSFKIAVKGKVILM